MHLFYKQKSIVYHKYKAIYYITFYSGKEIKICKNLGPSVEEYPNKKRSVYTPQLYAVIVSQPDKHNYSEGLAIEILLLEVCSAEVNSTY